MHSMAELLDSSSISIIEIQLWSYEKRKAKEDEAAAKLAAKEAKKAAKAQDAVR